MTLIPTRAGVTLTEVKDRDDLPLYELGDYCMVPGCENLREKGDGHHVWRRSNQTKSWWVELEDGTLVPNRVGLCPECHRAVTGEVGGHKAKIVLDKLGRLVWLELRPTPWDAEPEWCERGEGEHLVFAYDPFSYLPEAMQLTVTGEEKPHDEVVGEHEHGAVKPGTTCPTCKRRVNHKKKKDSPNTKVFGYRVPLDDAETHEELLEAAALAVDKEFTTKPHWKWALVTYALGVVLQGGRLEESGG